MEIVPYDEVRELTTQYVAVRFLENLRTTDYDLVPSISQGSSLRKQFPSKAHKSDNTNEAQSNA